jgi:hypothetical protein
MAKFEALSPEQVRESEQEAIKRYSHDESDHPHIEPQKGSAVLARFKAVFPFQLFPDELIVEEKRIIWIHRFGPRMCEVVTLLPIDINRVEASAGPIFGHLHVSIPRHDIEILVDRLTRKDAFFARDLIDGLVTAVRENIPIAGETTSEKVDFLTHLSHVSV